MLRLAILVLVLMGVSGRGFADNQAPKPSPPVRLIFDTDLGNDVDDALALGMVHALQSRGECELVAVTITKDHELCAPFADAINTFYGRGDIPIGVVRDGPTKDEGGFNRVVNIKDDGAFRFPHTVMSSNDVPDATVVLRKVLATQPDNSVVIVQVGFSSNLARLLASEPDEYSDLNGHDLAERKVRFISIMAGAFQPFQGNEHREYNVVNDIPAAKKVVDAWPTPIVYSPFEVGVEISYPAASIEQDFRYVEHHPVAEAYQAFMPTPHERPTWDLTSVLYAVRPDRGYFDLSAPGRATVDDDGRTTFKEAPDGSHRYLIVNAEQRVRVREALAQLASQPPDRLR